MKTSTPIVILAAGNSGRMYPLCNSKPKGDILLGGISLIARTVCAAANKGFNTFVLVVNSNTNQDALTRSIAELHQDISISYVLMNEATGMGNALLAARPHLEEQFFVLSPYHFGSIDLLETFLATEKSAVICTTHTDNPSAYGIVKKDGEKIVGVVEKPKPGTEPSQQKIVAFYLLNNHFIELLDQVKSDHYSFELALNQLLQSTDVGHISLDSELASLKYPWQLFGMQTQLFSSFTATSIHSTATIAKTAVIDDKNGSIIIEAGASVGHASRIVGPAYIGKNVTIGDFCLIRQSSIEHDAVIGANTELARSIILEKSSFHFGYMADSIVDSEVKIGAGLITANKRLDRKHIRISPKEETLETNLSRLGIIAGEKAAIGIQTSTMPGTIIGAGATILPGQVVSKTIPAGSIWEKR